MAHYAPWQYYERTIDEAIHSPRAMMRPGGADATPGDIRLCVEEDAKTHSLAAEHRASLETGA